MKILVAIPSISVVRVNTMLGIINQSSKPPDKVLIMSNNTDVCHYNTIGRKIHARTQVVIDTEKEGVNIWWNFATIETVRRGFDWLCLLNDDILFSVNFFAVMYEALLNYGADLVYPRITTNISSYYKFTDRLTRFVPATKRQGCAMFLSRDFIEKCPGIPEELVYFYGDDWYFAHATSPVKYNGCLVHHEVGGTTRVDVEKFRGIRRSEGKVYRRLVKEGLCTNQVCEK